MPNRLDHPRTLFLLGGLLTAYLCVTLPVFSQEAYYWTYAQHPDLSYYDHPPGVAWLIWLGTAVFGDGAIGVRFGTWACGMLTAWCGLRLLRAFGVDRRGEVAWLVVGMTTPVVLMTRCLANPDPPLVAFWTLALLALWRARDGSLAAWCVAGVAAGASLLGKYSAAFLAISGVIVLVFDERMRRQLLKPGPYLGVLLAAVVFSPVVIWNAGNHFESFRFQTESRFAKAQLGAHWFGQFVAGQFGMLHPIYVIGLALAVPWLLRRWLAKDPRALWLLAFGLPLPCYFLVNSLWIQVKINWLAPASVPLLLGLVVWWCESGFAERNPRTAKFVRGAAWVVPLICLLAPAVRLVRPGKGSSWTGWPEIAARAAHWQAEADGADQTPGNVFYFAADYRDSSQLGRNLKMFWAAGRRTGGAPLGFAPTLAQNVLGEKALQYDHWEAPATHVGEDAIFVVPRPDDRAGPLKLAAECFDRLEKVESLAIERLGIHLLDVDLYLCHNYHGPKKT